MVEFSCPKCKSLEIVKRGKRYNQSSEKQLYICNKCNRTFVQPDGFERMRHKPKDIVRAIHLHNNGLSLFYTKDHLWQHDGVKVTKRTISQWTKKFGVFLKSDKETSKAKT